MNINKFHRLLFAFLCTMLFVLSVTAQTSEWKEKVLDQLGFTEEECCDKLPVVIHPLPYSPQETVVIVPKVAVQEEDYVSFALDSYILLADSETGTIKSQFFESHEKNGWTSDAIQLRDISVDTTYYEIKPGVKAFGVELYFYGSSQPNPYSERFLSLFYI